MKKKYLDNMVNLIHLIAATSPVTLNAKIQAKLVIIWPLWPWNLIDDLEKQKGTFLFNIKCWNQDQIHIFVHVALWIWWMTLTKHDRCSMPHLALCIISYASANLNLGYCEETLKSGSNGYFFWLMWTWNVTDELEKKIGTSSMPHVALCIIL